MELQKCRSIILFPLVSTACLLLITTALMEPTEGSLLSQRPFSTPGGGRKLAAAGEPFTYDSPTCRAQTASLTDFGGVGDGKTSNTKAFQAAVQHLSQYSGSGGGMLIVPSGRWLTGPFELTSHFTLFLHSDAVILATQNIEEWPLIEPLPSYGRGRDEPGQRYSNLIGGSNLTDVVITGNNGTIDGQGSSWWEMFRSKKLKNTRGYLIELMYSDQIVISNITLINSPAWNIHLVYSSNILISGVTILAPVDSPNTDGIDPDSCSQVRIEDCYIVSGDDCIAIKSGWDEYGIAYGMPSQHIVIRRLTCISPYSAVIALGSEMSGGIRDVRAEDITAINSESGIRVKTALGRGAYVKDIFVRGMDLHGMKWVFLMSGNYNSHPDDKFDPKAVPVVDSISYSNVLAQNVSKLVGSLVGIQGAPFTGICISNVTAQMWERSKPPPWNCTDVKGISTGVVAPTPCVQIADQGSKAPPCPFPADRLPIDDLVLKKCAYSRA